ncbi:hypothetical protein TNCT_626431 [Trichonephila clavata]|uniref:Uncharacterized protein n=1 Tax=Trichonephila clavata TaxID=2740835 RepID=A0A8X6GK74_TRICU|nr:hypothetical protein TNCT_626431 [Trichonephila clavata]
MTAAEERVSPIGTLRELSSFKKIERDQLGRIPPSYPWYFGRNTGGSFRLMRKKYQTAFSRFISDQNKEGFYISAFYTEGVLPPLVLSADLSGNEKIGRNQVHGPYFHSAGKFMNKQQEKAR